ncbi:MAG TPA: hypothetical protein VGH31_02085, partial [Acidimicrobiales bacterium]
MNPAQDVVEAGLAAAAARGADGCVVLVDEASHADVRFAVNTTTTNGVRRDRTVSVVVMVGTAVGMARRSGVVDVDEMVAAALLDARSAPAAEDAFALVGQGSPSGLDFGSAPIETDLGALSGVLSGLGGAFGRARQRDVVLAGFAEFGISTLYLGSSTGLRVAHSQPTGAINLVGRSLDGARSVWTGVGSEDLASVS